ncbi:MAG: hypothetical protein COX77_02440 [Candidatus Komeilibacteria bacterium CG_4_10_14_0_2_um_filter_37_10]|uniref:Methyltransferase type 11 domain-containing protein n=1 Tax=Candidatus Komeilibacteria bacterium CG_4_10_14_0_2_um_filter_37_10 TaxID=1974470 RepID=A0A2M7VF03_9BACT|nr:MAG: hypothetical protein COX77_02440 [Candidatus Komeilibacteria bacterium CG_4_10_14_0_2_um_filter_37_10]PJA92635.1 MAG: hypothetical protein CO133_02100 [Candidatus Komeilibacteria bacterium CG_4_9_14_3_um_filter_37_5]
MGVDGAEVINKIKDVHQQIIIHDPTQPLKLKQTFDLVTCIEVAEHLPEESADTLVDSLCRLAPRIFFTAAVPGQGPRSIGHINEQPHEYWQKKFADHNFCYHPQLSHHLRRLFKQQDVSWWVRNNTMVFEKK